MAGEFEGAWGVGERTGADVSVPGTPLYVQLFGQPDDEAWERAHHYYTNTFSDKGFSDIQEQKPAAIEDLECAR